MSATPNDPVSPSALKTGRANLLARRRLLRGGLSAAPVLMAAAPRSVMAGTVDCRTGSAFTSVNPSGAAANTSQCLGHLPEYWGSCSLSYWPDSCKKNASQTLTFDEVFGSTNSFQGNPKLLDVLGFAESNPKSKLGKYVVASLLNVRKNLTPTVVMSEATVKAIWNACSSGGFYEPTAGVQWYSDYSVPAGSGGCVAWLKSTMS